MAGPHAIRVAGPADLPRIAEIVERAYRVYIPRIGRRPGPMDDDYATRVRRGQVFVAGSDTVVGLVVLISSGDHVLIDNVAVHPDNQHQGSGGRYWRMPKRSRRALAFLSFASTPTRR